MTEKRRRNYADFWDWPNKDTKEAGIMDDFLAARDKLGLPAFDSVAPGNDPPDFVARRGDRIIGIELTELVSREAVEHNIRVERYQDRVYWDCSPESAISALQRCLNDKDKKVYTGGPFDEIRVVVHTDEPSLLYDTLRGPLTEHRFTRPRQIHRGYLLFSYQPGHGACPLIELRFDD